MSAALGRASLSGSRQVASREVGFGFRSIAAESKTQTVIGARDAALKRRSTWHSERNRPIADWLVPAG